MRRAIVLFGLIACVACAPELRGAKQAQRVTNTAGHALARVVVETCEHGYQRAEQLPPEQIEREVERLDRLGCIGALQALSALSAADSTMVALVDAYEAGQCQATIARDVPERCDLVRTSIALVDAGARLEAAVAKIRGTR